MAIDVSTPSGLASTLTDVNACTVNYIFRMLLSSIPMVVILGIFSRYIQIDRERQKRNDFYGDDFLITAFMSFVIVVVIRLIFSTWEYFGTPVGCIYGSLGFNNITCQNVAAAKGELFTEANPSNLGIKVCGSEPYVNYLSFGLTVVVYLSKLTLFSMPLFILFAILYKSASKMFEEVRERRENVQTAAGKLLVNVLIGWVAVIVITQGIYNMMYVDFTKLLEWAVSYFIPAGQ